mgnify:CR=1 FL=1
MLFTTLLIAGILTSPYDIAEEKNEKIKVVVTILPQAEFVEKVGGEKVHVIVMIPPGYSPHSYEPKPSQLMEVSKARIYFQVGSGVEFEITHMKRLISINANMLVVNCSEGIDIIDRDPHVWLSPRNAKVMVINIYKALARIDPKNEGYYRHNMERYLRELDRLDEELRLILSNITNRVFMVYHPAWGYFAHEYNLTQIPVEREGKRPTIKGMAMLIDQARRMNIKVIFVSPQFDVKSAQAIAEEIGGKVIFADPLAKNYINNLKSIALKISEGASQNG